MPLTGIVLKTHLMIWTMFSKQVVWVCLFVSPLPYMNNIIFTSHAIYCEKVACVLTYLCLSVALLDWIIMIIIWPLALKSCVENTVLYSTSSSSAYVLVQYYTKCFSVVLHLWWFRRFFSSYFTSSAVWRIFPCCFYLFYLFENTHYCVVFIPVPVLFLFMMTKVTGVTELAFGWAMLFFKH